MCEGVEKIRYPGIHGRTRITFYGGIYPATELICSTTARSLGSRFYPVSDGPGRFFFSYKYINDQ